LNIQRRGDFKTLRNYVQNYGKKKTLKELKMVWKLIVEGKAFRFV